MPDVARRALVSEATAYRYFPDLASLLREALAGVSEPRRQAMEPVAGSGDPVDPIGFATEGLLREVLAHQAPCGDDLGVHNQAVGRGPAAGPPVRLDRRGAPPAGRHDGRTAASAVRAAQARPRRRGQRRTLFTLTDLCGLTPEAAIASAAQTARSLTAAALGAASA